MSKHSSSPAKSEEPNKKHKPEDQQTPSWAQEILREMKDLKSTLGTKCDEAKISADQAKQSANDTKKAFTSMESKIQDLERRLQILEAKPPSPSPNPQSSATLRARSQGAHVTEDEEQKRLRTAVVTGWNRDSMSKAVLEDVDELLKSLPRKIDVKVSTPGPRCSMAFLEFQDVESMIDFLKTYDNKTPPEVNDVKIYCHPNKTRMERTRDHAMRKFWRTLLTKLGPHQDRFARNYHRGIIWVDSVRVAEWNSDLGRLDFHQASFDGLNLEICSDELRSEWEKLMKA